MFGKYSSILIKSNHERLIILCHMPSWPIRCQRFCTQLQSKAESGTWCDWGKGVRTSQLNHSSCEGLRENLCWDCGPWPGVGARNWEDCKSARWLLGAPKTNRKKQHNTTNGGLVNGFFPKLAGNYRFSSDFLKMPGNDKSLLRERCHIS